MKIAPIVVVAALTWLPAGSHGQTSVSTSDFSLPPMQLRSELKLDSPPPSAPSPFPVHALDTNSGPKEVSAATGDMTSALESYNARSDRFYLVPPANPPPQTPLSRTLSSIGDPEIVHFHGKPLACSVVTAVKRKNPLCLLNATFLKMTW